MSRRGRKKLEFNPNEWLTTYSDMMTLLLCFFILLYAFSTIDAKKFKDIAFSLSKAFSGKGGVVIDGGSIGPTPIDGNIGKTSENQSDSKIEVNKTTSETQTIYNEVLKFIAANNLNAKVEIKKDAKGVIIELQEKILFDSGKADIKPESLPLLKKITELLKKFPNEVMIEGNTDNLPINKGYYQSNWELSSDRAVKIVRFFTETQGLDGTRFLAVGCGEYKPIDSNNTPDGRQKNRRVSILIVSSDK